MLIAAQLVAGLAAVLHVVFFVFESLLWTRPEVYARFGIGSRDQAETIRPMAFNQGFYNLFLAIITIVGIVIGGFGHYSAACALIFAGTGSMLAAAVVLLASSPARFHERMILSHIKAWTFRPAMKDGRPVRYRLRIRLAV